MSIHYKLKINLHLKSACNNQFKIQINSLLFWSTNLLNVIRVSTEITICDPLQQKVPSDPSYILLKWYKYHSNMMKQPSASLEILEWYRFDGSQFTPK